LHNNYLELFNLFPYSSFNSSTSSSVFASSNSLFSKMCALE
ncbi:hypothetical protein CP02DC21_1801, partial [Chlamydia psittaci 02DC21]